jgi:peptidylprolyl isomerase
MRRHRLLTLPLAAFALPACGSSDDSDEPAATLTEAATEAPTEAATEPPAASSGGGSKVKVTGSLKEKPTIKVPGGDPPAELVIKDIKKGTGPEAEAGQTVDVQYVGVLYKDGTEFDASWNRGAEPFSFPLGQGQVIPGWDQGVAGMKVGGRRVLTIPPDLAYGPSGAPPTIGPNETLVFVVDLKKVSSP